MSVPYVFVSPAEIMTLPTTGAAWTNLKAKAVGSWATPTIADQNASADMSVLAGALYGVRLGDEVIKTRVRASLMALVSVHPYDRVLSLARELPGYIIAADLVGLDNTQRGAFNSFLVEAAAHKMDGHSGGDDLRSTARLSPNNWGTMARAAMAAIDVYLNDIADLAKIVDAHKAWCGELGVINTLKYTSTNWHAGTAKYGVNKAGTMRSGNPIGGVIPEDQRRTGEFTWPAPKGSYPWEALQGEVLTGVILARKDLVPFNCGNSALIRAAEWLTTSNLNPASGDDKNTPWMLNRYGSATFKKELTTSGKNIAYCDWILQ